MQIIKLIAIIALPFLISCNMVSFEKPMPLDGKTLTEFPKSMIGSYYYADRMFDSAVYNEHYYPSVYKKMDSVKTGDISLLITATKVVYVATEKRYYDTTKIDLNSISLDLSPEDNLKIQRKSINKYVLFEMSDKKEIVDLSKNVLKEKNGIYYVNFKDDEQRWSTYQIVKSKKGLINVNEFSIEKLDSIPSDFNISKTGFNSIFHNITTSQFDYLIKNNYFTKIFSFKKE